MFCMDFVSKQGCSGGWDANEMGYAVVTCSMFTEGGRGVNLNINFFQK